MSRTRAMTAKVRRALEERWPHVREAARAQLGIIREFALAGESGTAAQRLAARSAAHKLVGSLGMFGRGDASAVAAAVEDLLLTDLVATTRHELCTLVDQLDGMLSVDAVGSLSSTLDG